MFNYLPLKPENHELRLVRLRPGAEVDVGNDSDGSKIFLDLQHVSINDETPYAAVSYVWGSATSPETIEVQVNDEPFNIGRNLHAALTEFRRHKVDRWLWIDAICIHQSNQEEKSWHVDRMRHVFRDAEIVYIWLGPSTVGSDVAMDFIAQVGPRALDSGGLSLCEGRTVMYPEIPGLKKYLKARSQPGSRPVDRSQYANRAIELGDLIYDFIHEPGWLRAGDDLRTFDSDHLITGMQDLLRRDYWHRVWVIQEVTLARQAQVYCGRKTVTLDELDAVWSTLFFCVHNEPDKLFQECQTLRGPFPGSLYPSKAMEVRQRYHLQDPHPPIRLVDILLSRFSAPHRHIYTTDPRDFVFGLLGVLSDEERLGMHADYSRTTASVLAQFTKTVYRSQRDQHVGRLSLVDSFPEANKGISSYPTWVPDWETIGKYGSLPHPFFRNPQHAGAAGELLQPSIEKDRSPEDALVLRRHGCRVAVVTEVMPPPEWRKASKWPWDWKIQDFDKWLQSIREFTGLGSGSGSAEDYIWRTLACKYEGRDTRSDGVNDWKDEQNHLVRKIMRREPIDIDNLTKVELDFFWKGPYAYYLDAWGVDKLEERVDELMHSWPEDLLPR